MDSACKEAPMRLSTHGAMQNLRDAIEACQSSERPILVGPWLTEIGFEVLYWIPFLRWVIESARIDPERLIIVSRGGCRDWYADLGAVRYVDVFDLMSVNAFRHGNERRVLAQNKKTGRRVRKHFVSGAFDQTIISAVMVHVDIKRTPAVLHPSLMYQLFRVFWTDGNQEMLDAHTRYRPMARPPAHGLDLPERYVAVKWYASECFPDNAKQRAFVQQTILTLLDTTDVVLLETGMVFDDHSDLRTNDPRLHRIKMTPATNLQIQTRVIAGASALVGTYGGFSYLGPLLGIPTTAYYAKPDGFRQDHLKLAQALFAHPEHGRFTVAQRIVPAAAA